jgi:uncharacterized repeat protein (TIGR03803 family)
MITTQPAATRPTGIFLALFALAGLLATGSQAQTITTLKSFNPDVNPTGFNPEAPLLLGPGNMLYGTASSGGTGVSGVVFKVQTDGAGFTVLWNFSGGSDGGNPEGGLVLSGSTLYGTTSGGGTSNAGTIFTLNTDGGGFTNIYSFSGGNDGANPVAGLLLSGNTLYGTASAGGSSGDGTIFAVNRNGGEFSLLKTFAGADGAAPDGALVLSGSTLYGTAYGGGADGFGTVFEINTNGGGYATLYSFTGRLDCGNPYAGLILSGSFLYGTTTGLSPEIADFGSIFKINTSGGSFTVLKTFLEGDGDGANPYGNLVLSSGNLYGTTESGTPGYGTVFKISTSGTGFTNLYSFYDGGDGANPYGGLVWSGSTLYGATYAGGASARGTVFEINTSGSGFNVLANFSGGDGLIYPEAPLVFYNGTLYGTTSGGGSSDDGTVFAMNSDGSGFTVLKNFTGADGANPNGGMRLTNGVLLGTTGAGGAHGNGTVFEMNTDGSGFVTLHNFAGAPSDGASPLAGLTPGSDGNFYGTTWEGGGSNLGTVFQMTPSGTLVTLASFSSTNGAYPTASVTQGSDGFFYGSTGAGGIKNSIYTLGMGTIFRVSTNGDLVTLVTFGYTNGLNPQALTLASDGNFYSTTGGGGSAGVGTVFKISANGALTTLHSFSDDGNYPMGGLALGSDGNFYGTTQYGGSVGLYSDLGTVFQVTTNGTVTTVVSFAFTNGSYPQTALTIGDDGNLYGTTTQGGAGVNDVTGGTVFRVNVAPTVQAGTLTNGSMNLTWSTVAGWKYQVQYNSDLTSSNWINLSSPATAVGATLNTTDSVTNSPQRFYRVMISP